LITNNIDLSFEKRGIACWSDALIWIKFNRLCKERHHFRLSHDGRSY
jgi:hypothetical protein